MINIFQIPKKLFSTLSTFEYLYGINPISIALAKHRRKFEVLYISDSTTLNIGPKLQKIIHQAQKLEIPIKYQHRDKLTKLVNQQPHQNIVLKCSQLKPDFIKEPHEYPSGIYVYCDKITDPQNFGSIIRSCIFFGVKNLFIPKKNCCPLNSTVSKTSAGALELMQIDVIIKQQLFLDKWKEDGGIIISTDVVGKGNTIMTNQITESISLKNNKIILVMGSQGTGVSPHINKHANFSITIPNSKTSEQAEQLVDSLNVSSALTCILYQLKRNK